jgi:hypothetical protein
MLLAMTVAVGVGVDIDIHRADSATVDRLTLDVSVGKAEAGRYSRATRRTHRATRNIDYYNDLPKGCEKQGQYYYCNGTYYMPRYHNGRTQYVVVYP